MEKGIDAKVKLELLFRPDGRVFFNFWDAYGEDIACQVVEGKIMEFAHSEDEAMEADDPFEQKEISFGEFVDKVAKRVKITNQ